ncbi:MAG: 5-formyltetrahydrofolate cyclo-ligase [Coriobacteriia bacterium]|nr:5-formyltetrahydrofolate cyclo-ligase [Coriobacteriia bacterium]
MDFNSVAQQEEIDRAKSALRLKARAARRSVQPEMRNAAAYAIAERVLGLPELEGASAVMLYGACEEEADPGVLAFALRELGVRIAYPRVAGLRTLTIHWVDTPDSLVMGPFDLLEPCEAAPVATVSALSVIIAPGVAFDPCGNRLGFGGGFYDSMLGEEEWLPPIVGIAYDEQIFDSVPHDERDRQVDVVVTPTRTIRCRDYQPDLTSGSSSSVTNS